MPPIIGIILLIPFGMVGLLTLIFSLIEKDAKSFKLFCVFFLFCVLDIYFLNFTIDYEQIGVYKVYLVQNQAEIRFPLKDGSTKIVSLNRLFNRNFEEDEEVVVYKPVDKWYGPFYVSSLDPEYPWRYEIK